MAIQARTYTAAFIDRTISWLFGFPTERCSYTVQDLRIPVSTEMSRFELAADLFQPVLTGDSQLNGTLLMNGPYGRQFPFSLLARMFAARGYQVLFVSSRGTFGSGGEFDPFRTEVEDGRDVVEWMRKQAWYTGRFATVGASYMGFTQWALLQDNPPSDMVAAVMEVVPHDFSRAVWGHGALDLDIVRWSDMVAHQEEGWFQVLKRNLTSPGRQRPVLEKIPLGKSLESYFAGYAPWLFKMSGRPDLSDPHYTPMRLNDALDRADIPILLITGWNDIFLNQTMEQYSHLQKRGCNVALIAGPWTHMAEGLSRRASERRFDWLEENLAGKRNNYRTEPVEYYVTGANEWRSASVWPPQTSMRDLFLDSGRQLEFDKPPSVVNISTFVFNPRETTPIMGGNLLYNDGKVDDSKLFTCQDVLNFTTKPLDKNIEVCGYIVVELSHSTSSPYADLFVRISEVDPKDRSFNITETFQRLDPNRKTDTIALKLNPCAHRFLSGNRIRLYVAGGNFPHYAKNIGTANDDELGVEVKSVTHTVRHGGDHMSRIKLPVVVV